MFSIFSKKAKTPAWENLTDSQKRQVTSKLVKAVRAMAGARYKVVSGFDET